MTTPPPSADYHGLAGKTAIVTGAGAQLSGVGNGRATAALLAQAGANVVLVDVHADRMTETEQMITDLGGRFLSIPADVSNLESCDDVVRRTIESFGSVDVLVNNVGVVGPAENVVEVDVDEWERCFRINVTSMMLMSRFVIPHMERRGSGSIVNISSMAGVISHPRPAYAASKGAVISLTKSMAVSHGPSGIRVNAVAPGMVYTPNVQIEGMDAAARAARAAASPLGVEGTGWDVADAILYLASSHSKWVSGICLYVDGGFSADLRISGSLTVTPTARS